jgi:hypothetical protein
VPGHTERRSKLIGIDDAFGKEVGQAVTVDLRILWRWGFSLYFDFFDFFLALTFFTAFAAPSLATVGGLGGRPGLRSATSARSDSFIR